MRDLPHFQGIQWYEDTKAHIARDAESVTTKLVTDLLHSIELDGVEQDVEVSTYIGDIASNEMAILERHPNLYGAAVVNAVWFFKNHCDAYPEFKLHNQILLHALCGNRLDLLTLSQVLQKLFYGTHSDIIDSHTNQAELVCELSAISTILREDNPDESYLSQRLAEIRVRLAQENISRIQL